MAERRDSLLGMKIAATVLLCALLSACGGMNEAVTVVPDTLDDLAAIAEQWRKPPPAEDERAQRAGARS
jgi:hypothetical protein